MPPDDPNPTRPRAGEVYFEFITFGQTAKVSAIDAATGTEVSISGPVSAGQKALERTALQKLLYVMGKKKAPDDTSGPGTLV